jgi:predicted nucleotidyltransferase
MQFHRALNEVFRSWTHVAVMRALQDTTVGFTGNQVAREAHMHPRSAFKALGALEVLGLVHRRRGGRDHLFTLNRDHVLLAEGVIPVLEMESQMLERLRAVLRQLLSRKLVACIIFGSVARREENPESDVDLCCIVRNERERTRVQDVLDAHGAQLFLMFGAKIAPTYFTEAEFRGKGRSPLVKEILADGTIVAGKFPGVANHG